MGERFEIEVSASTSSFEGTWTEVEIKLLTICEENCGRISGKRDDDREAWWWNKFVQILVKENKLFFKGSIRRVRLTEGHTDKRTIR